jgi:type II secretory pathway pseudopilin PulG
LTVHPTSEVRRVRAIGRLALAAAAALLMVACGDDNNNSTPTTPTASCTLTDISGCVSETFTGTVNQNGAITHNFTTTNSGNLSATLSVLGPDSTQVIGMSLGTSSGGVCTAVLSNDRSTQGSVIVGAVSSLGSICVRAYDVGTITAAEPFTYEITVLHP